MEKLQRRKCHYKSNTLRLLNLRCIFIVMILCYVYIHFCVCTRIYVYYIYIVHTHLETTDKANGKEATEDCLKPCIVTIEGLC